MRGLIDVFSPSCQKPESPPPRRTVPPPRSLRVARFLGSEDPQVYTRFPGRQIAPRVFLVESPAAFPKASPQPSGTFRRPPPWRPRLPRLTAFFSTGACRTGLMSGGSVPAKRLADAPALLLTYPRQAWTVGGVLTNRRGGTTICGRARLSYKAIYSSIGLASTCHQTARSEKAEVVADRRLSHAQRLTQSGCVLGPARQYVQDAQACCIREKGDPPPEPAHSVPLAILAALSCLGSWLRSASLHAKAIREDYGGSATGASLAF